MNPLAVPDPPARHGAAPRAVLSPVRVWLAVGVLCVLWGLVGAGWGSQTGVGWQIGYACFACVSVPCTGFLLFQTRRGRYAGRGARQPGADACGAGVVMAVFGCLAAGASSWLLRMDRSFGMSLHLFFAFLAGPLLGLLLGLISGAFWQRLFPQAAGNEGGP